MARRTRRVTDINPYGKGDKTTQVGAMFDHIAPAYDFMNGVMSFGLFIRWRDRALRLLARELEGTPADAPLLDVATGTGDVAMALRRLFPSRPVTGIDLSEGMLALARDKAARRGLDIDFRQADCLRLPFAADTFAALTAAYGVRNFSDLEAGYREMLRVLRPGATACVIELSEPRNPLMHLGYRAYVSTLVPLAGRLVSHDASAYSYLPRSVAACPARQEMTALMLRAGFSSARWISLWPGAATIYLARK